MVVGAVLASALLSTTSIYTEAIRDLGLKFAVREAGPNLVNPISRGSSQTAEVEVYTKNRDEINRIADQRFGALIEGRTYLGRSSTFYPAPPGQPFPREEIAAAVALPVLQRPGAAHQRGAGAPARRRDLQRHRRAFARSGAERAHGRAPGRGDGHALRPPSLLRRERAARAGDGRRVRRTKRPERALLARPERHLRLPVERLGDAALLHHREELFRRARRLLSGDEQRLLDDHLPRHGRCEPAQRRERAAVSPRLCPVGCVDDPADGGEHGAAGGAVDLRREALLHAHPAAGAGAADRGDRPLLPLHGLDDAGRTAGLGDCPAEEPRRDDAPGHADLPCRGPADLPGRRRPRSAAGRDRDQLPGPDAALRGAERRLQPRACG